MKSDCGKPAHEGYSQAYADHYDQTFLGVWCADCGQRLDTAGDVWAHVCLLDGEEDERG